MKDKSAKCFMVPVLVLLVLAGSFISCSETPAPPDTQTSAQPTAPSQPSTPEQEQPPDKPAEFVLSNLKINPAEAVAGDNVTISVEVRNTGDVAGTYTGEFVIDGDTIKAEQVSVSPAQTQQVSVTISRGSPGVSLVTVSDLTGIIIMTDDQGLFDGKIVEKELIEEKTGCNIYDITYISDGLKIKGYLAEPETPGIHAAVIWNRGGNREFSLLNWNTLVPYATAGYVAVGSQYRGNGGSEGKEQYGGEDVSDVINLIPLLKSMPVVDSNRIGIVGFSRGGMMTYIALKEQTIRGTDDIKVACTFGGMADLFLSARRRPTLLNMVMHPLIGGTPADKPEEYEARSAVYWADQINVPLLMQHGEDDQQVSVESSKRLAQELEKYDKVYKLITYPGDNHTLSKNQGGRPEILDWLGQYLR